MSVTRRFFLRNTAAAGAVVAVAAPSVAAVRPMTQAQTIEFHACELAKAMRAVHPDIEYYEIDHALGYVLVSKGMKRGLRIDGGAA